MKKMLHKIKVSLVTLVRFFDLHPWYALLAMLFMFIFYEIVYWILNIGLAEYLIKSTDIPLGEKLSLIPKSFADLLAWPMSWNGLSLFLVSLFQGVAFAALVYLVRRERSSAKSYRKELTGTGFVGLLAVLGLGCIPCGTSLVMPILTFFFASSASVYAPHVAGVSTLLALILTVITVYLTGRKLIGKV